MDKNENNIENEMENCSIRCTINELNDDCLRIIFSYLPIVDRIRIERVSKRWQSVSKDSWHDFKDFSLDLDVWGLPGAWVSYRKSTFITNEVLENVLKRCGRFIKNMTILRHRSYQVWNNIDWKALEIFGRLCTNLESLNTNLLKDSPGLHIIKPLCKNFKQFYFVSQGIESYEDDFLNLFKLMKKLNSLFLVECNFTGECLSYLPMNTIQGIYLRYCYKISTHNLCNAIQRLETLHTLVLCECASVNDSLLEILTSKAKTLKALVLNNLKPGFSNKGLKLISKLVCLEKLQLDEDTNVTNEVINVIADSCKQLSFLDVSYSSITDEGIFHISFLPKLRHLNIANLSVTGQYLGRIHTLEYLNCKFCASLKNDNVCALIELSPHLQILDLEGCELIDFKVVKTALKDNTQRKKLTISIRNTLIFSNDKIHYYPSANLYTISSFRKDFTQCLYTCTYFSTNYEAAMYPYYESDNDDDDYLGHDPWLGHSPDHELADLIAR